ncbi:hypothetical protein Taro_036985 [Colocasia esculenta]|uniref:Uncharacterized protein n=1 Tax=Colocasia esculenta TaxID=4460 RepID=A0A843W9W6_COLES|nr:hypothetical protein [Colocasia esculenta]
MERKATCRLMWEGDGGGCKVDSGGPSGSSTGYIGRFIVEASAKVGNPTFLLIRKSTAESIDPNKAKLL